MADKIKTLLLAGLALVVAAGWIPGLDVNVWTGVITGAVALVAAVVAFAREPVTALSLGRIGAALVAVVAGLVGGGILPSDIGDTVNGLIGALVVVAAAVFTQPLRE